MKKWIVNRCYRIIEANNITLQGHYERTFIETQISSRESERRNSNFKNELEKLHLSHLLMTMIRVIRIQSTFQLDKCLTVIASSAKRHQPVVQ